MLVKLTAADIFHVANKYTFALSRTTKGYTGKAYEPQTEIIGDGIFLYVEIAIGNDTLYGIIEVIGGMGKFIR